MGIALGKVSAGLLNATLKNFVADPEKVKVTVSDGGIKLELTEAALSGNQFNYGDYVFPTPSDGSKLTPAGQSNNPTVNFNGSNDSKSVQLHYEKQGVTPETKYPVTYVYISGPQGMDTSGKPYVVGTWTLTRKQGEWVHMVEGGLTFTGTWTYTAPNPPVFDSVYPGYTLSSVDGETSGILRGNRTITVYSAAERTIADEDTPLGNLPQTGTTAQAADPLWTLDLLALAASMAAAGLFLATARKKEEDAK